MTGLLVIGGAAAGGIAWLSMSFVQVGMAYKAKMICSEVFVANRSVLAVVEDIESLDLRPLRFLPTTVAEREQTVTTSFPLLGARRAAHREGGGCVLDPHFTGTTPAAPVPACRDHDSAEPPADRTPSGGSAFDAILDAAFAEPDSTHPRRTRAVVVLHRGTIVAERYAAGFGPASRFIGWSMTKSVLNALVGVAVQNGDLALDDSAGLDAWPAGDARRSISVRTLLQMSSGLAFDERMDWPRSDVLTMLFGARDMAAFAANRRLEFPPGTRWQYSSGTSVLLSRLLREKLGEESYRMLPSQRLFGPLGMCGAVLEADATGTFVASSYMYATAREWARFGQLYLRDGVWNGTRILPDGWVRFTTQPASSDPHSSYGAHFWLATPLEYRGEPATLPSGVFSAVGHEGQFVTIVPSHDVVIVRLGRTRHPGVWAHDAFVQQILAAIDAPR